MRPIAETVNADPITTSLYSLIATICDIVGSGYDRLVIATAVYILRSHRVIAFPLGASSSLDDSAAREDS